MTSRPLLWNMCFARHPYKSDRTKRQNLLRSGSTAESERMQQRGNQLQRLATHPAHSKGLLRADGLTGLELTPWLWRISRGAHLHDAQRALHERGAAASARGLQLCTVASAQGRQRLSWCRLPWIQMHDTQRALPASQSSVPVLAKQASSLHERDMGAAVELLGAILSHIHKASTRAARPPTRSKAEPHTHSPHACPRNARPSRLVSATSAPRSSACTCTATPSPITPGAPRTTRHAAAQSKARTTQQRRQRVRRGLLAQQARQGLTGRDRARRRARRPPRLHARRYPPEQLHLSALAHQGLASARARSLWAPGPVRPRL